MSSLKQALVITKNTSQKDFEEIYGMLNCQDMILMN
jgi:hypothetical protein